MALSQVAFFVWQFMVHSMICMPGQPGEVFSELPRVRFSKFQQQKMSILLDNRGINRKYIRKPPRRSNV